MGARPYYHLIFNEQERQRWQGRFNSINNIIFSIFLVSLLPIFFHKRLPVLKRYTSRTSRVLFGVAWVFLPANLVGALLGRDRNQEMLMSYNLNMREFKRYQENKDIL